MIKDPMYVLECFERLSFEEKADLIFHTGARLEAKFHKGHLLELYCMGEFFVQIRYSGKKPDQIHAFIYNDEKVDFFLS